MVKSAASYFPRIGLRREFKNALEDYWDKKISKDQLIQEMNNLIKFRFDIYAQFDLDYIPSNDFTYYDYILDLSYMFNCVKRFANIEDELELLFAMARGTKEQIACEMTKWFDTNYHYIVPEFSESFALRKNLVLERFLQAKQIGYNTRPIIIGPFTFIRLGKIYDGKKFIKTEQTSEFKMLLLNVAKLYNKVLLELQENGATEIQIDEPALTVDYNSKYLKDIFDAYEILTQKVNLKITLNTYYESLLYFNEITHNIKANTFGLDFTFKENIDNIGKFGLPANISLQAGIISGRHPFRENIDLILDYLRPIQSKFGLENLVLSNSSPLMHLPTTIELENVEKNIIRNLAFAKEKLGILKNIKDLINQGLSNYKQYKVFDINENIKEQLNDIKETIFKSKRKDEFSTRYFTQLKEFNLPIFPTTTIGSFPQTKELRKKRADYNAGKISKEEYGAFIKSQIKMVIELQERLGLDVLVHGEFERSDMVEFFAQKLEGFLCTQHGWVISYGSRAIRPPIIYGNVKRNIPLTLNEITYAQSLTKKIVKGILTGPVTMVNWSYTRIDMPKEQIMYQIALALKQEIAEIENAGIKIIQIDEPAFREGLPLRKSKQKDYLIFATNIFRFTTDNVAKNTQIHTHMCYSDFNDIIEYIYEMDADCISIEASRSKGEIIEAFENFHYTSAIGIGIYDIHSPRIPQVEEMLKISQRCLKHIDYKLLWINPDCGLKTRKEEEVIPSLKNMIEVAKILRKKYVEVKNGKN